MLLNMSETDWEYYFKAETDIQSEFILPRLIRITIFTQFSNLMP